MSPEDTLQELILSNRRDELIAFLQNTPQRTHKAIKATIRQLSQQLFSFFIPEGDIRNEQCRSCYMAALLTFTRSELMSIPSYLTVRTDVEEDMLIRIFQFRNFGSWLPSWINTMIQKRYWIPSYAFLKRLESRQLISYEPHLFGRVVSLIAWS
ncbi:hypothetical protein BWI93_17735 [Siphonobacter sp. BAB-5385]|nr:DUF6493 family protein [Siphonobacter sp. BAB-5385]OZI06839.1 hypothetical protein BWI93_17735 [Siphonobacter sp. BAB-5385]